MTNIAMENPVNKWSFLAGKIIYFNGPFIPWLCQITRGYIPLKPSFCWLNPMKLDLNHH